MVYSFPCQKRELFFHGSLNKRLAFIPCCCGIRVWLGSFLSSGFFELYSYTMKPHYTEGAIKKHRFVFALDFWCKNTHMPMQSLCFLDVIFTFSKLIARCLGSACKTSSSNFNVFFRNYCKICRMLLLSDFTSCACSDKNYFNGILIFLRH